MSDDLDTTPILTDEQIVELVKPVPLEDDPEDFCEDITVPMTAKEKIRSFSGCVEALNEDPVGNADLICALSVLIRSTKAEEHRKRLDRQMQSKVTDFSPTLSKFIFTQNSIRYTFIHLGDFKGAEYGRSRRVHTFRGVIH